MTLPKYPDSSLFTVFEEWLEVSYNGMDIFSRYWSSYLRTILQLSNLVNSKNSVNPYATTTEATKEDSYNPFFIPFTFIPQYFVDASNSELNKQLRSKDFLQSFKIFVKGIANLDSIQKQNFGYSSLSNADSLIDQLLAFYNNNLVSINQTPNRVLTQIGKTRILHYFNDK